MIIEKTSLVNKQLNEYTKGSVAINYELRNSFHEYIFVLVNASIYNRCITHNSFQYTYKHYGINLIITSATLHLASHNFPIQGHTISPCYTS